MCKTKTLPANNRYPECSGGLAVARDRAQLARQEMVGWPGAAYNQLAVLQLFCCGGIPVLIFFHRLGINQVGNVDQHPVRGYLLTANFLVQGVEELVDLDGKRT